MIVSRNELRQLRSRRNSQNNFNNQHQFQMEKQAQQNKVFQIQKFKRIPMSELNLQTQYHSIQNTSRFQQGYNNKRQGFIRSNTNTVNNSVDKNQSSIKNSQSKHNQRLSTQKIIKMSKKMSLDVNLTNKGLTKFSIQLPNNITYRQLYSINISNNKIIQILPTILNPFDFLKQLEINNNLLQKISFPYNKMQLKKLSLNRNNISNLNLEHLKCLEQVNAAENQLIFVTLPETIKILNLQHNQLSNIYFVEKSTQIQYFNIAFNFIYDLNFNSFNQNVSKSRKTTRYAHLKELQCSHNKISHLHGLNNISAIENLNIQFNQLSLSRQNLNQLFELKCIQNLNMQQNPLQGSYSIQNAFEFLFNQLTTLKLLNGHPKQKYFLQNSQQNCHSRLIDDQSSINCGENTNNQLLNSEEKPFRLFLDSQDQQKVQQNQQKASYNQQKASYNQQKTSYNQLGLSSNQQKLSQKKTQQWNFTLGDCSPKDQDDSRIYQLMTMDQQPSISFLKEKHNAKWQQSSVKDQIKSYKPNLQTKKSQSLVLSQKIMNLQRQISRNFRKISLNQNNFTTNDFTLSSQTKSLLKLILHMSFICPCPLGHGQKKTLKRLDEDEDEYILFSKLFINKCGIFSLMKFYQLQKTSLNFSNQQDNNKMYALSFINVENVESLYKDLIRQTIDIQQLITNNTNNIKRYFSPVPNAFKCHHIVVRHLVSPTPAFQKKLFAPVYYLVQSKRI